MLKHYEGTDNKHEQQLRRVGAYCRVSRDRGDQANSFESQQRYFKEHIDRDPQWALVDIFC